MIQIFNKGNAVKVTHQDDEDLKRIGVLTSYEDNGFVMVDFGTHQRKMNVNSLFDITYDNQNI